MNQESLYFNRLFSLPSVLPSKNKTTTPTEMFTGLNSTGCVASRTALCCPSVKITAKVRRNETNWRRGSAAAASSLCMRVECVHRCAVEWSPIVLKKRKGKKKHNNFRKSLHCSRQIWELSVSVTGNPLFAQRNGNKLGFLIRPRHHQHNIWPEKKKKKKR